MAESLDPNVVNALYTIGRRLAGQGSLYNPKGPIALKLKPMILALSTLGTLIKNDPNNVQKTARVALAMSAFLPLTQPSATWETVQNFQKLIEHVNFEKKEEELEDQTIKNVEEAWEALGLPSNLDGAIKELNQESHMIADNALRTIDDLEMAASGEGPDNQIEFDTTDTIAPKNQPYKDETS